MLKGVVALPHEPDVRLPITLPVLDRMLHTLPLIHDNQFEVCMYSALLTVGFHGLFHPGELAMSEHVILAKNVHIEPRGAILYKVCHLSVSHHNFSGKQWCCLYPTVLQMCCITWQLVVYLLNSSFFSKGILLVCYFYCYHNWGREQAGSSVFNITSLSGLQLLLLRATHWLQLPGNV